MSTPVKLNKTSLSLLPPQIQTPKYDRTTLQQNTVHLGVGGFHRAHQALYLDDLLALPDQPRWGECGVGVLPADRRMRDALRSQDFLYTLVERSAHAQTARIIGSLVDDLLAPEDREAVLNRMAAPEARILSLTITEGGYYIDDASGDFQAHHPDIRHDLEHPTEPTSSLGLLAAALDRRRLRGLAPVTLMSCDNLQGNGHVLQKVLLAFTGLSNPTLQQWMEQNIAFPNSMVDRITPQTTPADIAFVASHFGIEDAWPVVAEPFRQWVIEDTFSNGRPAWQLVGAEITTDVAPYELMKMRLLNGSHLAMAYLGALQGFPLVQDMLADPLFADFIRAFMEEVTPVVPHIPGVSVTDYKATLMERFANPTINDQVTRICSEGSAKMPKWLLPSITELTEEGAPTKLLSLVVAAWIFYLGTGTDRTGAPIDIIDARAAELRPLAAASLTAPTPFLNLRNIFGPTLPTNQTFLRQVTDALKSFTSTGITTTLRTALTSS